MEDNFELNSKVLGDMNHVEYSNKIIEEYNNEKQKNKGNYDTFMKRMRNYSARERRIWNLLIVLITLYNSIVIPLKLSFRDTWTITRSSILLLVFDYLGDIFLILDIILRFMTPYYSEGFLIREPKSIALYYLTTWYPILLSFFIKKKFRKLQKKKIKKIKKYNQKTKLQKKKNKIKKIKFKN